MEWLKKALGQDLKSVVERERASGGYSRGDQTIDRGPFESVGDRVFGRDTDILLKEANKQFESDFAKTDSGIELNQLSGNPLYTGAGGIGKTETAAEAQARLGLEKKITNVRELATAKNVPIEDAIKATTVGQIGGLIKDQGIADEVAAGERSFDSPQNQYIRSQADLTNTRLDTQFNTTNRRLDNQESESRRRFDLQQSQLAQDRLNDLELRRDTLGLRQQEQADRMTMFNQKLENDRYNRKQDRMASIMSALGTLGTAFAIN